MSIEAFKKSAKAAEQAGLFARSFSWNPEHWRKVHAEIDRLLAADAKCTPHFAIGFDEERKEVTLWAIVTNGDDEVIYAENISFPCPPNYPPSGPPCPGDD